MSADRYTTCPRCVHEYENAKAKLAEQVHADYPNLSDAAKEALLPVLTDEAGLTEPDRTFREEYEFAHTDDDPTVQVVYEGRCSACGLELKIDETHTIWTRP